MENKKLKEILQYYKDTFKVDSEIDDVYDELISNNVEVNGDSFFCPIYNKDLDSIILLAGTKEKASMWVLKKIIKVLKSGKTVYTMLNGNATGILPMLQKYNAEVVNEDSGITYLKFN